MLHNIEILLVEDNESDAKLTTRILKKNNLCNNLIRFYDGAEALDYLFARANYSNRRGSNKNTMILLDLNLPKIGGLEVLHEMRKDERTKNIPVAIMISSKEDREIIESYNLRMNSCIVKPVTFDSFMKISVELGLYWMLTKKG